MKIGKITLYVLIFGGFLIFAKLIFQTYHNFFNDKGENETIILNKINKFELQEECEFQTFLPVEFTGGEVIVIKANLKCEPEVIAIVGNSFSNRKARKKFVKLASRHSTSEEVKREGNSAKFNIQTTSVVIEREKEIKITIENLNKKYV
jgi:hypothetical protein